MPALGQAVSRYVFNNAPLFHPHEQPGRRALVAPILWRRSLRLGHVAQATQLGKQDWNPLKVKPVPVSLCTPPSQLALLTPTDPQPQPCLGPEQLKPSPHPTQGE